MNRFRLAKSFRAAGQGFVWAVTTQQNLQLHLLAGVLVASLAGLLRLSFGSWAILLLAILAVIGMELMNTAIEAVVDLVSPEFHPLAGRAKDVAAAAVLAVSLGAAIVGLIVLGPPLWAWFTS